MGKRSDFARVPRDFFPTPREAVQPLLPHLNHAPFTMYIEPCAGDGALIDHLDARGHLALNAYDIEPRRRDIEKADATSSSWTSCNFDCFITNPPWDRTLLHPIIFNLSRQAPTWLLFDADWMHTRQSVQFMPLLRKIVSVGRVKWIPDSKMTGKDNCCWYLFDANKEGAVEFVGR